MKTPLIVQKFGGTSMGSIERIHTVAQHVIDAKARGQQVVVVVSAMSGETNRLLALAHQVDRVPNARELDVILSAGEQVSMALLAMTLHKMGYSARSFTGSQLGIVTTNQHNDATILQADTAKIQQLLNDDTIVIVAGFQGVNENGDITTLGRGGSDTTAVTLAGMLAADECQIFTDVDGIYSTDPRIVGNAQKLDVIDFPSMEEMSRKGAKVLHLPCVQYAWQNQVPLRVLSTFEHNEGTLIRGEDSPYDVCGIAVQKEMIKLSFESHHVDSILKQCHLLGIDVWNVIGDAEFTALLIKQDASAKLGLVFEDKIRNSKPVSLLTVVGKKANDLIDSTYQLLCSANILIDSGYSDNLSHSFVIAPEQIDSAANVIHEAYVISGSFVDHEPKQRFMG
ncbi:aspartate kinase [Vibrio rhizosphaerae]|uniref:Aspartokinase n=1 Tax=Vibrio rhizosphaerae TaxID=398736 RepID=A0ABU4IWQ7_9VIBR|nr:aspartate kinase [Vibrio rhizosphaerae]MDW6093800.1 aspartate kinase [Vibrio rhizosphaerae]